MDHLRTALAFTACLVVVVSCGSSSSSGTVAGGGAAEAGAAGVASGGLSSGGTSASGGHSAAGQNAGGHSAAGQNAGGQSAGGTHTGGGASGGTGGGVCGPCPGYACANPIDLTIAADPSTSGALISDLKVVAPGLDVQCMASGGSPCTWFCQSVSYQIADGDYTVTISAPGFSSATVDIHALSPTNCGCCGCCPFSLRQNVTLTPSGTTPSAGCCANLDTDPTNCGACGHACPNGAACTAGKCP